MHGTDIYVYKKITYSILIFAIADLDSAVYSHYAENFVDGFVLVAHIAAYF